MRLEPTPTALPGGAAGVSASNQAVVLIDDGVVGRFGPALAWAARRGAVSLDVIVDGSPLAPAVVARRAACFARPARVWSVAGAGVEAVLAGEPVPAGDGGGTTSGVDGGETVSGVDGGGSVSGVGGGYPAELDDLARLLDAHGLEVVWEHGVLRGEVLGLEVARTIGDHLEVGVGRHDRMARMTMRPSEPVSGALVSAAEAVRARRRPGAAPHPANRLARSRWLRSVLVANPSAVGCTSLQPVAPPLPWIDLPDAGPAPAIGARAGTGRDRDLAGAAAAGPAATAGLGGTAAVVAKVVVVCCVGVDLDLVPTAADSRLAYAPGADLLIVVPAGDDVAVNRELAGALARPATIVTVGDDWASGL